MLEKNHFSMNWLRTILFHPSDFDQNNISNEQSISTIKFKGLYRYPCWRRHTLWSCIDAHKLILNSVWILSLDVNKFWNKKKMPMILWNCNSFSWFHAISSAKRNVVRNTCENVINILHDRKHSDIVRSFVVFFFP